MAIFDKEKLKKNPGKENAKQKHIIMIVDDEEKIRESLTSLLKEEYEILTASDGQEALDIITGMGNPEIISLIISDQRMPRLTGVELFKKLKDIIPSTIRIIITAFEDTDINDLAKENAQIKQIIHKPYESDDFKQEIRDAIKEFELQEQK